MKFRFIHTSDIHLGSILNANECFDNNKKKFFNEAVYNAFSGICRAAVEQDASFIVIAGDLFDNSCRSVKSDRFFVDKCREMEKYGIDIIVISGNHDPLGDKRILFQMPENVHFLCCEKPEAFTVHVKGEPVARVIGQSYKYKSESRQLHKNYPNPDDNLFNIGMLHTQMDSNDMKYLPCTLQELIGRQSFHYWALGHIHKPAVLNLRQPAVVYAGTPQGRDFGEEGFCGCCLVEVDGTEISYIKYLSVASVVYKRAEIDIGIADLKNAGSLSELEDYIRHIEIKNIVESAIPDRIYNIPVIKAADPEGYILRFIIKGRGSLHNLLSGQDNIIASELAELLNDFYSLNHPFIFIDSIDIHTCSPASMDDISDRHPVLKGLLDQLTEDFLHNKELMSQMMSDMGKMWYVSNDHEEDEELRLRLDDETYKSIIENAKRIILEDLAAERR